jgi:uncharacterized protein with PQ loop repeat
LCRGTPATCLNGFCNVSRYAQATGQDEHLERTSFVLTSDAISGLYMASCTVFVFSYVPQILAVASCRNGARSTSLVTWSVWTVSSAIALAYGVVVVQKTPFIVVNVGSFVCCLTILLLAAVKRRRAAATPDPNG